MGAAPRGDRRELQVREETAVHQQGNGQGNGQGGGQGTGERDGLRVALGQAGLRWRPPEPDDALLAIDDTDNLDSPGTGFRARELALLLAREGLTRPLAITRHQLLVDPRIPYTSHNSSACLLLTGMVDAQAVFDFGCRYLGAAAAEGSDAAIVLLRRSEVTPALRAWGQRAKTDVLELDDARRLASDAAVAGAELTGTGGGLIGALAAIGLHATGHDGRLLWLRGLRELAGQRLSAAEVSDIAGVCFETLGGQPVTTPQDPIALGDWPRAIFRDHRPVLLVEEDDEQTRPAWRSVARELIKQF